MLTDGSAREPRHPTHWTQCPVLSKSPSIPPFIFSRSFLPLAIPGFGVQNCSAWPSRSIVPLPRLSAGIGQIGTRASRWSTDVTCTRTGTGPVPPPSRPYTRGSWGISGMPPLINDKAPEENGAYTGQVQHGCKNIHRCQFRSPHAFKPSWGTLNEPVDLHHPAKSAGRPAKFDVLAERDDRKPSRCKKNIPLNEDPEITEIYSGPGGKGTGNFAADRGEETGVPAILGECPAAHAGYPAGFRNNPE